MPLSRDEAWQQFCGWTQTESLRRHGRAVEEVMRAAASRYGPPDACPEHWAIAGLLHDADYERWPADHPRRIVDWLVDRGEKELAHAISAHYSKWKIPHHSELDRALLACDELTGFVMACALVRPDGIESLEVRSVKKKLKDRAFAAKVERDEIDAGVGLLGVDLGEHIGFVIETLKPHADELGLGPRNT
ncbi:MAG: metal-dependent phosphohydrolase [Planctomycetes bacterium]|nr:metal-dependent phosphohydrolase [Planctomycetota bacterium]